MTTPEAFKNHTLTLLSELDTLLPNGSHIFIFGVA